MNKQKMIEILSSKMKLVRVEKDYTQEEMADVLGLSKKTLVQIEKDRMLASWTTVVALCALFRDSQVIHSVLGSDPLEVIETIAHKQIIRPKEKTLGGKVWWKDEMRKGAFRVQQNVISQHYRILDDEDYRWYSTFNRAEVMEQLDTLINRK